MARKTVKAKFKLPSSPTGRRRLLKLAGLLERDANNAKGVKFDLGTWAKPSSGDWDEHYATRAEAVPKQDCGTAACAVGLACLSGAFAAQGLTMVARKIPATFGNQFIMVPAFGRKRDFPAVQRFFDLDIRESDWLFLPGEYRVSKGRRAELAVAKRIRNFVAGVVRPPKRGLAW